ncbi:hypothetical protein GQ457_06G023630 [Hibiscus cannabinus]
MVMTLSAKNKLGFVDGSISAPPSTNTDLLHSWNRANNMVNSRILNSVSKDIVASLLYHSTASAIWNDLEDRFAQNNGPRIFQLKKKLGDLVQGSMSIKGAHYAVSNGLNESFATVRGQILLMDPLPNIIKVFSLVVQEENQRLAALPNPVAEATFAVKASFNPSRRTRPQCSHCGLLGHTKEKCYKLHGYPPGYGSRTKNHVNNPVNNVVVADSSSTSSAQQSLTSQQCQQLISMLTSQLHAASTAEVSSTSINLAMQGKLLSFISSLMIGKGEFYRGLYLLQLPKDSTKLPCSHDSVALVSWHHRLGHPSSNVLQLLKTVLPSDHYDFSCSTWTYLLKHKSDVISIVPSFISMVKRQFGYDLRQFRSDNAHELRFTDLFSSLGILHQFSCVQTPQQNSVVERKHQQLLAVARALFFQSRVPIRFWGECLLTATYIINRLPSKNLDGKSPYELLHSQTPTYSHLKTFGCMCFVATLKSSRDKFTGRALPGVFIGYASGVKGYKVYVLQTRSIVISRNVVFHEDVFPFHSTASLDTLIDHFPNLVLPHNICDRSCESSALEESTSVPLTVPVSPSESTFGLNDSISVPSEPVASAEPVPPAASAEAGCSTNLAHAVRRSSRIIQKPSYLNRYYCNNTDSSSCLYPVEEHISPSQLSTDYHAFVANLASCYEPVFYHQAVKFPEWRLAMDEELQAMDTLQTWSVVSLPEEKMPLIVEGIDYIDTFSPVAKMTTFKLLLSLVAVHNWCLFQLDVNNAFLNGMLDEEVYMKLPLGYKTDISGSNLVCKLHKSIYGLKQASRQWFHAFYQVVMQFGFTQSHSDHSLFIKGSGNDMVVLLVYVDDIILAGKDPKLLTDVRIFLQQHFKLKDLGTLKYFLGFEIARNQTGISLSQRQYAFQLLEETSSLSKKPAELPLTPSHKLSKDEGQLIDDPQLYRSLLGRLLYLTHTRPDITHAVNLLSQFVSTPRQPHLTAVYHLLSYVKASPRLGLFFSSNSKLQLTAFVDSDYDSCPDTRRSTTGYCTYLRDTLIS